MFLHLSGSYMERVWHHLTISSFINDRNVHKIDTYCTRRVCSLEKHQEKELIFWGFSLFYIIFSVPFISWLLVTFLQWWGQQLSNHYATQNDRFLLPLDNFGKGQQKKVRVEVDLEACWGTNEAGLHFVRANLVLK